MDEKILEEVISLASELKNRDEVIQIKNIQILMRENQDVLRLVNDFNLAQSEYNSCLNHFDFESEEAKKVQKVLFDAKMKLDSHPLVKEYYLLLNQVNEPLHYIELNLLSKFKECTKK